MEKKYELTDETIEFAGRTLYKIRYLRDFGSVTAGDLGGFIEKEENLSHDGDAKVYGNAWVYDNAMVSGNAWVYGNARVSCAAHYFCIGPIGSRKSYTTFYRTKNGIGVTTGCFTGTLDEFKVAVLENHKDTKHAQAYLKACELAELQIEKT